MRDEKITSDYQLNLEGEVCPYPAIAAIEAMAKLKKGEVLEVVSDCAQSINNIPIDAKNHGYEVLKVTQEEHRIYFFLRK